MNKLMIIAGIAMLASATPALADPGHGNGNGNRGHGSQQGQRDDDRGPRYGDQGHRHGDEGQRYADQGRRHGDYRRGINGYWQGNCPPGLAKKHNGCLPPGIAKKRFERGQRWAGRYGYQWQYNQIPYDWRNQYNLDPRNRYYYGDGYLYGVDPTTMLVDQVIRAIIR